MTSRRESGMDFTELEDRGNPGEQFEQLMRDLFEADGLTVTFSGRGPDEGRDLIAEEELQGKITGKEKRRWLVWCRNNARSNGAVSEKDLPHDLRLKCSQHQTEGFLLATTTILTSGAQKFLDGVITDPRNTYHIKYWVVSLSGVDGAW